jgi:4-amino-4-deoxy-L-arabinose transferase-like glycosyltransferase
MDAIGRLKRFLLWRPREELALGWILLAVAILNVLWRNLETRPPHWDMARHLWISLNYWHLLVHHDLPQFIEGYFYYPPFVYWLTQPFYLLFGHTLHVAVFSEVPFMATLGISTYLLGTNLWSRRSGLLAAVVVITLPIFVTQFKEYQLDGPLAAMVTLSVYLLYRSEEFSQRKTTYVFFFAAAIGMLTKWTYLFAMALPVAFALGYAAVLDWREQHFNRLLNAGQAFLLAYLVISPWYLANQFNLKHDFYMNGTVAGIAEGDPVIGTNASNEWYFWNLINNQAYLLPFLLMVTGTIVTLSRRTFAWRNRYLLLTIAGTWLVFTFVRNKDARYTLPMLGSLSVLAIFWLDLIREKIRRFASAAIYIYATITFMAISFGISILPKQLSFDMPGHIVTAYAQHGYIIGPPSGEQWYQQAIFQRVYAATVSKTLYYQGPDTIWFNGWGNLYYRDLYGVPLVGSATEANFVAIRATANPMAPTGFRLVQAYPQLPDGTRLALFKRLQAITY